MIKEVAKALWAINEMAPKFEVTGAEILGDGNVLVSSNISGPLVIKPRAGSYVLINEGGALLFESNNLKRVVAEACKVSYADWLSSRLGYLEGD